MAGSSQKKLLVLTFLSLAEHRKRRNLFNYTGYNFPVPEKVARLFLLHGYGGGGGVLQIITPISPEFSTPPPFKYTMIFQPKKTLLNVCRCRDTIFEKVTKASHSPIVVKEYLRNPKSPFVRQYDALKHFKKLKVKQVYKSSFCKAAVIALPFSAWECVSPFQKHLPKSRQSFERVVPPLDCYDIPEKPRSFITTTHSWLEEKCLPLVAMVSQGVKHSSKKCSPSLQCNVSPRERGRGPGSSYIVQSF